MRPTMTARRTPVRSATSYWVSPSTALTRGSTANCCGWSSSGSKRSAKRRLAEVPNAESMRSEKLVARLDSAFDCDVVVVGAGPIGLSTACALRHHGVSCRIIERRAGPRDSSRANNLWSRPQELLATVGLRDGIAERSHAVRTTHVLQDGRPLDSVHIDEVASPYPAALYTGQDIIESTFVDELAARGTAVERERVLRRLDQDATGVDLTVSDADDEQAAVERIRCRYVVGADGSSGSVADALGLDIPTEAFEDRATRQIDVRLRWRRSTERDRLWFFLYHHGFAGVMPIWGDRHRLFFLEDDAEIPERDPTLEEMQDRARQVIGDETIELSDPVWTSYGRFRARRRRPLRRRAGAARR